MGVVPFLPHMLVDEVFHARVMKKSPIMNGGFGHMIQDKIADLFFLPDPVLQRDTVPQFVLSMDDFTGQHRLHRLFENILCVKPSVDFQSSRNGCAIFHQSMIQQGEGGFELKFAYEVVSSKIKIHEGLTNTV